MEEAGSADSAPRTIVGQLSGDANFEVSFGNDTVTDTTSALGTSTSLIDAGQNFLTDGKVKVGDTVFNLTDGSSAKVLSVANGSLTTTPLTGGTDNTWGSGDSYRTAHLVTVKALAGSAGDDRNASMADGNQRETAIAVNPTDSQNVVVAPNHVPGIFGNTEIGGNGIDDDGDGDIDEPALSRDSVWVTFDGGQSWEERVIPLPAG